MIPSQTPANFNRWSERGFKTDVERTCVSDEVSVPRQFNGKRAEAEALEMCLDAIDKRIALRARKDRGIELHDAWVGIQQSEWLAVRWQPGAEAKARRIDNNHSCHGTRAAIDLKTEKER